MATAWKLLPTPPTSATSIPSKKNKPLETSLLNRHPEHTKPVQHGPERAGSSRERASAYGTSQRFWNHSGSIFYNFGMLLGSFWTPFGVILASRALLGRSWALLGALGVILGSSWAPPGDPDNTTLAKIIVLRWENNRYQKSIFYTFEIFRKTKNAILNF